MHRIWYLIGSSSVNYTLHKWKSVSRYIFYLFFFSLGCIDYPCKNGGTCAETANGGYVCTCTNGWSGSTCEHIAGINVKNINCLTISKLFFRFMYFFTNFLLFQQNLCCICFATNIHTHKYLDTQLLLLSLSLSLWIYSMIIGNLHYYVDFDQLITYLGFIQKIFKIQSQFISF